MGRPKRRTPASIILRETRVTSARDVTAEDARHLLIFASGHLQDVVTWAAAKGGVSSESVSWLRFERETNGRIQRLILKEGTHVDVEWREESSGESHNFSKVTFEADGTF